MSPLNTSRVKCMSGARRVGVDSLRCRRVASGQVGSRLSIDVHVGWHLCPVCLDVGARTVAPPSVGDFL
eukprot:4944024-Pyramimonas_sp.AAC.2